MKRVLSSILAISMFSTMFLGSLFTLPAQTAHAEAAATKIPLSPAMVTNESGYGDTTKLVDEQALSGEPGRGAGGTPKTFWFGDWNFTGTNYPVYAYIDLGQEYNLSDVYVYDIDDVGDWDNPVEPVDLGLYTGKPGEWNKLGALSLTASSTWLHQEANQVRTRFVRIEMTLLPGIISEIVLYGTAVPTKIPLSPAMVTNVTGYGEAVRLVDEQAVAGDPLNGSGGAPKSFWFGEWNTTGANYPAIAYIDLGQEYYLTQVCLFDYDDPTGDWDDAPSEFKVFTGNPGSPGSQGNWNSLFDKTLTNTNKWVGQDVANVKTRYVQVSMSSLAGITSEVVIYGYPAEALIPAKVPLSVTMVKNIAGQGEATSLVDEQAVAGNPLAGSGGEPTSTWTTSVNASTYIDLGQEYKLKNIVLRDANETGTLTLYSGSRSSDQVDGPDQWTVLFADPLRNYNSWNAHPVDVTTRYIRLERSPGANVSEIVVYGTPVPKPILLTKEMVNNELNLGDATLLVDEQGTAGDPLAGTGKKTTTSWKPSLFGSDYPAYAYLDLGREYELTNVALHDLTGIGLVSIYAGDPVKGWEQEPLFEDKLVNYETWNLHPVSVTTRYVRLKYADQNAEISELVLYGTPVGGAIVDTVAPAAISNLEAVSSKPTSIMLKWSAPGDDGMAGAAAFYDMRYSLEAITKDNWASATPAANLPAPLGAGKQQNATVQGLLPEQTYYFAMKSTDESGNQSEISNVITYRTAAVDLVPPAAINDLAVEYVSGDSVRLTWTATGDDGTDGTASSYSIRYSNSAVTESNWGNALQAGWAPLPKAAGTKQSVWINNLSEESTYSFAIRTSDETPNISLLSNVASAITTKLKASTKVELTGEMILNEATIGDATLLVDEQQLSGDPKNGTVGEPKNNWDVGYNVIYLPASAVIDLGVEHEISDIYLYDGSGTGDVTISAGDPFNWQETFTDKLEQYMQWSAHPVKLTTRYLQVKKSGNHDMPEIVIYGSPLGAKEAKPQAVAQSLPTMDQLIGINAFIDDPLDKMSVAGFVREYHDWNWNEGDLWDFGSIQTAYPGYPNNENKFNPSYAGGGGWNFDAYYAGLKAVGIEVSPAIQGSVSWLTLSKEHKPISIGTDALDPASYAAHADHMYQYAARYGSEAVADNKLKLAVDQPRSTGLNLLQYYENGNENDKWWTGRDGYSNPYEYAAMSSADYDGHLGAMGDTLGIKNADPNAKLVMSGLARPELEYVRAIKFWSEWNRDGSVPIDALNIHHYSSNGNDQQDGTSGISPEQDKFKDRLKEFVDYRNTYMPGKEVWITEFGYDTNPQSMQHAPAIGDNSAMEVQGQWIVRSYLAAAAAGVDKAAMYMLRDTDSNSTGRFGTSGLTASMYDNWAPKISWYYVYTLKNTLKDFTFDSEVESGNPKVSVYKFKHASNGKTAYAVWSPTSNDTTVDDYRLTLEAGSANATLVTMENGDVDGVSSALSIVGGKAGINVSERPVFVVVSPTVSPGNVIVSGGNSGNSGDAEAVVKAEDALKNGKPFTLDTTLLKVTFSADQLKELFQKGSKELRLTVKKVNAAGLSKEAVERIGNHPIYDIVLKMDGVPLTKFTTAIKVQIPYQIQAGENPNAILVYYITEDGKLETVKNGKYDEKTGQVTFYATHFSRYALASVVMEGFSDLMNMNWAKDAIEALSARDILKGKGSNRFDPQGEVTRAEFLVMLVNALDLKSGDASDKSKFIDVAEGKWYTEAVNIADSLGIIKGLGNGIFGVDRMISREQMAVILYRTLNLNEGADVPKASFTDYERISGFARDAVSSISHARLMMGFEDGSFKPQDPTTRAQAAVLIYRVLTQE